MIKFLIGGSPCTHWSIAQSKNRETEPTGEGWELFKNYLIAKQRFVPDFFLYENNKSTAPAIKDSISEALGVPLQYINSALVSAQQRQRFYAHNCGNVPQPEDRGIILQDILETGAGLREKAYTLTCANSTTAEDAIVRHVRNAVAEQITLDRKPVYVVEGGQIEIKGKLYPIKLPDGLYIIRKLTVTEACRLQTMPDDYCRAVSATQAYRGLGNGWTAEVIIHILSYALRGVPKDEEIVVLSMYDGIGTGRYCFDKLGYHNVKYYAYEIDKYAMQIAMSNYPDIVQCGDAFQVRSDDWMVGE